MVRTESDEERIERALVISTISNDAYRQPDQMRSPGLTSAGGRAATRNQMRKAIGRAPLIAPPLNCAEAYASGVRLQPDEARLRRCRCRGGVPIPVIRWRNGGRSRPNEGWICRSPAEFDFHRAHMDLRDLDHVGECLLLQGCA
jgi:hypothetical protein